MHTPTYLNRCLADIPRRDHLVVRAQNRLLLRMPPQRRDLRQLLALVEGGDLVELQSVVGQMMREVVRVVVGDFLC
jgi:hypothetical protein